MMDISSEVVNALRQILPEESVFYPLHEPFFNGNEWNYTKECLDTAWVSTAGKYVDKFEKDIADYTGSKYAVAVVNGTAALHIALELAGVEADDEILVPALTFVATSNAVTYCNAIPHFVDCEEKTLGIDPDVLREYLQKTTILRNGLCVNNQTGRIIRGIIPMHTFGHPVNIESLCAVANEFNLIVIEDAAESLGSYINKKHTGTFGLMGVLSFNGNKIITTGGGGVILTDNNKLAERAKHITTTSKISHRWEYCHDEIGYNYRLPNINAALGCAQLEQISQFIAAKRQLYKKYRQAFQTISGVKIVSESKNNVSNYWLQTILLDESINGQRDAILEATNDAGIMTRPAWMLMHHLAPYSKSPRMELPVAESLARRLINIPSSPQILLTK